MSLHLMKEIEKLKKMVLSLSSQVEENVANSISALVEMNLRLADDVIDADRKIDEIEVEIEEKCLKILALYQPVAIDLRFVNAVIRINSDLERISDLAVNIARSSKLLSSQHVNILQPELSLMMEKVRDILRKALIALMTLDVDIACEAWESDDEIDAINIDIQVKIQKGLYSNPELADKFIPLCKVINSLERIADHATNITEELIHLVEGKIVRHDDESIKKRTERKFRLWIEGIIQ